MAEDLASLTAELEALKRKLAQMPSYQELCLKQDIIQAQTGVLEREVETLYALLEASSGAKALLHLEAIHAKMAAYDKLDEMSTACHKAFQRQGRIEMRIREIELILKAT